MVKNVLGIKQVFRCSLRALLKIISSPRLGNEVRGGRHVGLHENVRYCCLNLTEVNKQMHAKHKFYEDTFTCSRFATCLWTYDEINRRIVF